MTGFLYGKVEAICHFWKRYVYGLEVPFINDHYVLVLSVQTHIKSSLLLLIRFLVFEKRVVLDFLVSYG